MQQITFEELRPLAQQAKDRLEEAANRIGRPVKIYLHWTANHYDVFSPQYHINIGREGSLFISTEDLSEYKLHTPNRNGGALGICVTCGYQFSQEELGPEPPTDEQIEALGLTVAILTEELNIPIDVEHVLTHAEAADNVDQCLQRFKPYGPRSKGGCWDFWVLKEGDVAGSGGNTLRGKALWYRYQG